MIADHRPSGERIGAGLAVAVVHALLLLALLRGLGFDPPPVAKEIIDLIDLPEITPPAEPPPPPPSIGESDSDRRAAPRPEGAASPPNLESDATQVVAPPPVITIPPPIPAAPKAGFGSDPSAGAALVAGPGTGSGGIGDGTGSGGAGGGDGGGGGGGGYGDGRGLSAPRLLRGRIRDSDYPPGLGEAGIGGTVSVRYTVEPDGHVTGCIVTRSSGNHALDRTTCRVIEQRFLFDPSRDRRGRPIRSQIVENHEWVVEDLPDEPAPRRPRRRLF